MEEKKLLKRINKFIGHRELINNCFLKAFFMTIIIYSIAILNFRMRWHTIDEWRIAGVLSGDFTGEPNYYHSYINILLGMFYSSLYKVIPQIPWWYVGEQLLMVIGITLVNYVAISLLSNKSKGRFKIICCLFVTEIIVLLHWIIEAAYTTAPVIMCGGVIMLVLFWTWERDKAPRTGIIILIVWVAEIISTMYRNQVGICLLPYYLLILLYYFNLIVQNKFKKYLYYCGICLVILASVMSLLKGNNIACKYINEEKWSTMFEARVHYSDYPHDSYSENPQLFEQEGITESEAALLDLGCFFEDVANPDAIMNICKYGNKNLDNKEGNFKTIWNTIVNSEMAILLIVWFFTMVISAIAVLPIKKKYQNFMLWLFNNLGCLIMLVYIMLRGRMVLRALLSMVYPSIIINVFLLIITEVMARNKILNPFYTLISFVLLVNQWTYLINDNASYSIIISNTSKVEEYVKDNLDSVYFTIGTTYNKIDPFSKNYANILRLATGDMYSISWRLQMQQNEIEYYSGDVFMRDDVYFMSTCDLSNEYLQNADVILLLEYLMNSRDCKGVELCSKIEGTDVCVYKYVFDDISNYDNVYIIDNNDNIVSY